jgi:hypothetical protein
MLNWIKNLLGITKLEAELAQVRAEYSTIHKLACDLKVSKESELKREPKVTSLAIPKEKV